MSKKEEEKEEGLGGYIEGPLPMLSDEGIEVFIPAPKVEPFPEALVLFDQNIANMWLKFGFMRLQNVFESVRFEPEGIEPEHVSFCLFMAIQGLFNGAPIYVPKALCENEHLAALTPIGEVGGYCAFVKP